MSITTGTNSVSCGQNMINHADSSFVFGSGIANQIEFASGKSGIISFGDRDAAYTINASQIIALGKNIKVDEGDQSNIIGNQNQIIAPSSGNIHILGNNNITQGTNNLILGNNIYNNDTNSTILKPNASSTFTTPQYDDMMYNIHENGSYYMQGPSCDINSSLNTGNYWQGCVQCQILQSDPYSSALLKTMTMIENNSGITDNIAIWVKAIVGRIDDPTGDDRLTQCEAYCISKWYGSGSREIVNESYDDILYESSSDSSTWKKSNNCKIYFLINASNQIEVRADRHTVPHDFIVIAKITMIKCNV